MKLVVAIIRPEKLQPVQSALKKQNIDQMTISNVLGSGHEHGRTLIYRSSTIEESLISRLKLEIAVEDSLVDSAIEAIQTHGKTGQIGDGVIFVMAVEKFAHIRAGEGLTAHRNGENRNGETRSRANGRSWGSLVAAS
jgi:nitrogen regulatory protein PII